MRRSRVATLAAVVLSATLISCNPQLADDKPNDSTPTSTASAASPAPGGPEPGAGALTLAAAIEAIPDGDERRDGYERDSFRHWIDEDDDGCETRAEVLLEEATTKPVQGGKCKLTGGVWMSYYDEVEVTDAKKLDIDHMVPLAEAWDSGAYDWTSERRQAYANDLGSDRSLVAVTAKTNRSKADRDPAQWLPPAKSAHCTYAADWTAAKLRWKLNADKAEKTALLDLATDCTDTVVEFEEAAE
ncbi:HNH endonuclease (plasmid) [Streptomyces sp. S501]|uniref:HNH endonuclease family protein n=1 Tax=Streptomyces sp. S501 TaxID=2420135 RepID=UPI00106E35B7|nr:HNH endonuclease family protein [Streptomyces sp. S501]QBR04584.1 HNH endonuclease [Streptomyces sp. S501]